MRHRAGPALLHGQAGLGAVEGLDLRLLVDRKHDGVSGRVDIEPDNIAQFVDELRVSGELELLDPMRLKTMRAPDPLHRACTDPDSFRHHRSSPMGRLNGRISPGERYNTLGDIRTEGWDARGSRLIAQQAVVTSLHKAFLQRHTQVFDLPVWRMISLVPRLSALNRTISARQTCL